MKKIATLTIDSLNYGAVLQTFALNHYLRLQGYDNKVIKFSRSKSPELIAYLIYKNGSSVNTKELLNVLYGSHADSARYGASLRNLIVDIKQTMADLEIQKFFITEYNNFRINPEVVHCDYYDFLAGDKKAIKSFTGFDIRSWLNANADWEYDISDELRTHLKANDLLKYLTW